jgi:hypothetical protein
MGDSRREATQPEALGSTALRYRYPGDIWHPSRYTALRAAPWFQHHGAGVGEQPLEVRGPAAL